MFPSYTSRKKIKSNSRIPEVYQLTTCTTLNYSRNRHLKHLQNSHKAVAHNPKTTFSHHREYRVTQRKTFLPSLCTLCSPWFTRFLVFIPPLKGTVLSCSNSGVRHHKKWPVDTQINRPKNYLIIHTMSISTSRPRLPAFMPLKEMPAKQQCRKTHFSK